MHWLATALAWLVSRIFTSVFSVLGYQFARRLALSTALIIAFASLFILLVATVKSTVMAARVVMPPILAQVTYFLPSNLPIIIATIVTLRVSIQVYRWTIRNMSVYASHGSGYGSLI